MCDNIIDTNANDSVVLGENLLLNHLSDSQQMLGQDAFPPNDLVDTNQLRDAIHQHLIQIGFERNGHEYFIPGELDKQTIRNVHSSQREELLRQNSDLINRFGKGLLQFFACGSQINPQAIQPELVEVKPDSVESHLFRFASLLWSVPVSRGFGRRLRFLIKDRHNGCLIGLFAIGDPVFNISARDNWIGWSHIDRKSRLVHVMDAYVVGAVPPYSQIIAGKLVAALIGSVEVRNVYERKYIGRMGTISQKKNKAELVLVTTTSALGRSSLYNRLKIPAGLQFLKIGYTKGYGHFHLSSEIFDQLRNYLTLLGHPYASGYKYGMGPNWKIRVARTALTKLGVNGYDILKHGIGREIFALPLAHNWREVLSGEVNSAESLALPADEISQYCVNRWMIPRAMRDESYKSFENRIILDRLLSTCSGLTGGTDEPR